MADSYIFTVITGDSYQVFVLGNMLCKAGMLHEALALKMGLVSPVVFSIPRPISSMIAALSEWIAEYKVAGVQC